MSADSPTYRAYRIHVGFGFDGADDAIRERLTSVFGETLLGVTTKGTEPATAVVLLAVPHRRGTPSVHHEGERLDVAEAVERAGFVHERAVPPGEYRDALDG